MVLSVGQTLSHYKILGALGAGAMGEVYRAKDTRLEREVAIKVLPVQFAKEEERLRRFEREAKSLASLNHPNVAHVYGIDQVDGTCFMAMELVTGEDLAARLTRGPLALEETVDVCRQIAEGLEAAHEAGVVHRDLKPANVRITPEGVVKILDFGLAKPIGPKSSPTGKPSSALDSFLMTEDGLVLGTPTYMSPEQARGKLVDRRTDIWAFGCLLYECLTGKRAFRGDSITDLLAAIVEHEPDWQLLPVATPAQVRLLLRRCLAEDPRTRLRDIGEARVLLADPIAVDDAGSAGRLHTPRGVRAWLPWLLATAALAAAMVFAMRQVAAPQPAASKPLTFEPKTFGQQVIYSARFLPDGQGIVYSAALTGNRPEVFLLQPGAMAPQKVAPLGTLLLSVSIRGELAVLTDTTYVNHRVHRGTLARMTLDGAPRALIESVRDADWGPDGDLAIVRRPSDRDRLEYPPGHVLYETSGYISEPRVSADRSKVAFFDHRIWMDDRGLVKVVDRDGKAKSLSDELWAVEGLTWEPGGQRLSYSGTAAIATGQIQVVSIGLDGSSPRRALELPGDMLVVDAAADGRWLMIQQQDFFGVAARLPGQARDTDLGWLDQSWGPSLSPDGKTVLFTDGHGGANYAVVTRRIDGSPISTLGDGEAKAFSPDGHWAAALSVKSPEVVLYPIGAGAPRHIERGPVESYEDLQWYPDGKHLFLNAREPSHPLRSYRQPIDGGMPEPVVPEGISGLLSPQGDRVAAREAEKTWKLYPLDGSPPREVPGLDPVEDVIAWSPAGDAIYVERPGEVPMQLQRVELATGNRTASLVIGPQQAAGLVRIWTASPVIDPALGYAYGYRRILSRLFLVK